MFFLFSYNANSLTDSSVLHEESLDKAKVVSGFVWHSLSLRISFGVIFLERTFEHS